MKQEKVTPWMLYFNTGKDYQVEGADGHGVIIPGRGDFRGKIQDTFWDFMEPVLENEIVAVLEQAQEDVKAFRGRMRRKHLDETRYLLQEKLVRGIFDDMVTVDQSLRGKGNPKKVLLRNIEDKLEKFDKFVVGQVRATQKLLNRMSRGRWMSNLMFFILGVIVMFAIFAADQFFGFGAG